VAAALIAGGNTEQLRNHLVLARTNGLTEDVLKEMIIHLCFLRRLAPRHVRHSARQGHLPPITGSPDQQPIGVTLTRCRPTNRFKLLRLMP
jgi:hypothetical protein